MLVMPTARCPKCRFEIAFETDATGIVCSQCGAKFKLKAVPKTAPPTPSRPTVRKAVVVENDADDEPIANSVRSEKPKKRKVRKNSVRLSKWHVGGAAAMVIAAIVTTLYLAWPFGGGGEGGAGTAEIQSPVDADSHFGSFAPSVKIEDPSKPKPFEVVAPKDWNVQVDPSKSPPLKLDPTFAIVSADEPVISRGEGRYLIRSGKKYDSVVPEPVLDITTNQPIGEYHGLLPLVWSPFLSPDGHYLIGPDPAYGQPATFNEGKLFVWKLGAKDPPAQMFLKGVLLWADFTGPREFSTVMIDDSIQTPTYTFAVWDVVTAKVLRQAPLEERDVTYTRANQNPSYKFNVAETFGMGKVVLHYTPAPCLGTVSPGGRYVFLGSVAGISVIEVSTGKVVGRLPVRLAERCRDDFRGFGFNSDGTELRAVLKCDTSNQSMTRSEPALHFVTWDIATGRMKTFHKMLTYQTGDNCAGPIYDGPEPDTFVIATCDPSKATLIPTLMKYIKQNQSSPAFRPAPGVMISTGPFVFPRSLSHVLYGHYGKSYLAAGLATALPLKIKPPVVMPTDLVVFAQTLTDRPTEDAPMHLFADANPRPKPVTPDRTAIAVPAAAVTWSVSVAGETAPPAFDHQGRFDRWPDAWGESEAAVIRSGTAPTANALRHVEWVRHDLKTGVAAAPVVLWPWASCKPLAREIIMPMVAALTRGGERLALCDPDDASRIDVFDDKGKWLTGFHPSVKSRVEWLAWCTPTRLLTKANHRVTGWEMPACKAMFEIADFPDSPLLPPSRTWMARAMADRVEFFDTATGRTLGRCTATTPGNWRHTSLSLDGRTLVRVTEGYPSIPDEPKSPLGSRVRTWDLATGQERPAVFFDRIIDYRTGWSGPRRMVVPNRAPINLGNGFIRTTCDLYDIDAGAIVATFGPPKNHGEPSDSKERPLQSDPFGRWWVTISGSLSPHFRPTRFDQSNVPESGNYPFRSGVPIRVRVELDGHATLAAQRLAAGLQRSGYTIAPDGWLLEATATSVDTQELLKSSPTDEVGQPLPKLVIAWRLMDPKGRLAWEGDRTEMHWNMRKSRYFTGSSSDDEIKTGGLAEKPKFYVNNFHFKGRSAHAAIVEEIGSQQASGMSLPKSFPRVLLEVGSSYTPTPIRGEYTVPAPK